MICGYLRKIFLVFMMFLLPSCSKTKSDVPLVFPKHNGTPVNDFAKLISQKDSVTIDSLCRNILSGDLATIVVCTIDSIPRVKVEYENPVLYGTDLFNYWGIGRKDVDDGVLILVSIKDKKSAICTGYLTEHYLPDSTCGRILDNNLLPHFKKGSYGKGIIDGIIAAQKEIQRNKAQMYPEK